MLTRLSRSSVITLALTGLLVAGCSGGSPTVTTSQSPLPSEAAPPAITRVTILAPSCENCMITAYRALVGQQVQTDYQLGTAAVTDGRVDFDVPTASTVGMSFGIGNIGRGYQAKKGTPFLVVGYGGRFPGTVVKPAGAALQKTGSWCWAGTDKATFTINLKSLRFDEPGQQPSKIVTFWASPTLNVPINAANLKLTYRGGIGISGVPFCTISH